YLLFDLIRVRVTAWINPWLDPVGGSYQIVQSLLAMAEGGIIGSGIGMGSPGVVPVAHSDFIFASIVEETGLTGGIGIILLLGLLASRGMLTALRAANLYQRYLAAGLTVYLLAQSIFIIGGNLRLLPLTGVTLPYVSYGGSSLLIAFIALALLLLINHNPEKDPAPLTTITPYLIGSGALLTALGLIALLMGWWTVIRSPSLRARADNPRWVITDRFVPRGRLLDRMNEIIAETEGEPGSYSRRMLVPNLGSIIGYTHPIYGQAALEAYLDPYLRGMQGNSTAAIWFYRLLYAQRPPGLDVRLSLDLNLQTAADELMADRIGALVLLNAASGEILVMSSQPNFDPNQLDEKSSQYFIDERSPLLNRATQGMYPPGAVMTVFLLADTLAAGATPALPLQLSVPFAGQTWDCALTPHDSNSWAAVVTAGCPAPAVTLAQQFSPSHLLDLYQRLGFFTTPKIPLPVAAASPIQPFTDPKMAALGQALVSVSPLQMSLAAASLSANGSRPSPLIATAVNIPHQGWVILHSSPAEPVFPAEAAHSTTRALAVSNLPLWQALANAITPSGSITWYLAGTLPDWTGTPLVLALVLEENNPKAAQQIGLSLLKATIEP
ncbi:MAG: FtsW/RodA/SpoVE family cell cycle protein, partial [Anaerolineaceae bacterium]|nr:FtsW/RodA/SpoVE family cell cycle protein [Anaerolineaceae bacterium]